LSRWLEALKYDPVLPLVSSGVKPVVYFARRDLLDEEVGPVRLLWASPSFRKIVGRQRPDGSWPHPGRQRPIYPPRRYDLFETWRVLSLLTDEYGLSQEHPSAKAAAEFILTFQSKEGDIRGFMANQYATYYTGAVLATLIKVGYLDDPRIVKGLEWLLSMRQDDGGWSIPILTHQLDMRRFQSLTTRFAEPLEPDRSKPFSHNWTDMALRAFAAHPTYRGSAEACAAAVMLKASFFKPDNYTSLNAASYWVRFLFWWPNLLTAVETLSHMGYTGTDPDVRKALDWFVASQQPGGLWKTTYEPGKKERANERTRERKLWLTLRVCRALKALTR
jgi:hypothetical protein